MASLFRLLYQDRAPGAESDEEKTEPECEIIRCTIDSGHQLSGRRLRNLNVVLQDDEVEDFVWTWHSECLLQERTLALLLSNKFTGFEVKPVAARFLKSARKPPRLWELVVTGWDGIAKPESGIRLDQTKSCAACGHLRYSGLRKTQQLIDLTAWDGSDFFMVWPMPRYVFITERVRNVIRENHLSGVHIIETSELKKTDGFSPAGCVVTCLRRERANSVSRWVFTEAKSQRRRLLPKQSASLGSCCDLSHSGLVPTSALYSITLSGSDE